MTPDFVQALHLMGAPIMGLGRSEEVPLPIPEVLVSHQALPGFWPDPVPVARAHQTPKMKQGVCAAARGMESSQ